MAVSVGHHTTLDRCGIVMAGVCLFHCAVVPLAMLVFPLIGALHESAEWLHAPLALVAITLCVFALMRGSYRHSRRVPALLGAIGILLLLASLFEEQFGGFAEYLASAGALFAASAHLANLRATRHVRATC